METPSTYKQLALDHRFQSFLWTQFLGAFNDNVFKIVVSLFAVQVAADGEVSSKFLALAGVVFVLPFLLFAGYAGQVADRFSKTRVLQITKAGEIFIMAFGAWALYMGRMDLMLCVLFLLACQANSFSPAKYGILPEIMSESGISRANGLLELSTFVAIVAGSGFGTSLFEHWKSTPVYLGLTLFVIAIVGSIASLGIQKVPAAGSTEPFRLNPFKEIIEGCASLRRNKPLMWSVIGISWFWLVGALFQMGLILAGKEVLHVSETESGLLIAALAVGIGIGSVLAGTISGKHIELGLVPAGALLMGIACVGFSMTRTFMPACAWLVGVGFAGGLFAVPLNAYLQDRSDKHERGRLLATNNFVNMFGVMAASGLLWLLHDRLGWTTSQMLMALGFVMIVGSVVTALFMLQITVRFIVLTVAKLAFRIHVEGTASIPAEGGALLTANHVSLADAVMLSCLTDRPVRFLMWRPLYEHALLHRFFARMGAIPVGGGTAVENVNALDGARDALVAGDLVAIFPEGHITRDGSIDEFKRGFERVVRDTGLPIIPVHIDGLYGHPLSYAGGGALRSWKRTFRPLVTVRAGEPAAGEITPEGLRESVLQLAEQPSAA
ncbi:MAG TPA: MFS transporter [Bryobacteraceae bacterium]|jgi:acyl-[acyl-carrier-protein]-phospholipid O-acyltransferase/long-chain-fatty-acid--[acyl-carrier-protein] ligase